MKRLTPALPWLAILLLSALLPLPDAQGRLGYLPPLCSFRRLTGQPCPGCGLTRSLICLGHGQVADSFRFHPLGPLVFLGVSCALALALLRLKRPQLLARWRLDLPAAVALLLALLALWPLRLSGRLPPLPE
jgi:hypothetical protein